MSGFFTDNNKKLHQFAGSDSSTKYCLPVGTIFQSAIPLTDASVHLLDGTTISQTGVYQEFAMLLKSLVSAGYNISCSQSDFDSAVSSTGNCGKFVIDNTSNTIRLPKITRFVQGLSNMTNIGDSVEAGLPNITGSLNVNPDANNAGMDAEATASGAITNIKATATGSSVGGSNWGVWGGFSFDASKSNSIYGKSTTVQPQATSFPYYIVLASGFTNCANLDIAKLIDSKLPITGGTMIGALNIEGITNKEKAISIESPDSDAMVSLTRTDVGNSIGVGIGGNGTARGIWDESLQKWLIMHDNSALKLNGSATRPKYNGSDLAFKPTVKFLWTGSSSTTATIENIGNYDFILISGKTTRTGDYWTTALAPTNVILSEISGYEYRIVAFGGTAAANYEFGVKINSATSITTYFTNLTWMQVIGIKF